MPNRHVSTYIFEPLLFLFSFSNFIGKNIAHELFIAAVSEKAPKKKKKKQAAQGT